MVHIEELLLLYTDFHLAGSDLYFTIPVQKVIYQFSLVSFSAYVVM